MLYIKELKDKESAMKVCETLQVSTDLLNSLYEKEKDYITLPIAMHTDQRDIGIICGVVQEKQFFLHQFNVVSDYLKTRYLVWFLQAVFEFIQTEYNCNCVYINERGSQKKETVFTKLIDKIPFCEIEKIEGLQKFQIATKDFDYFRKFRWYYPEYLKNYPFQIIPWKDYSPEWKQKIVEDENENRIDSDYLSPGIQDDTWSYDEKTSFVIAKEDTKEPVGWIITEKLSEDTVRLRRFYTYRKYRTVHLGPSFSTWVLEEISKIYKNLQFEVVFGNRQMEVFARTYCEPIMSFHCFESSIKIKLNEPTW
jgi:hypothetical protein